MDARVVAPPFLPLLAPYPLSRNLPCRKAGAIAAGDPRRSRPGRRRRRAAFRIETVGARVGALVEVGDVVFRHDAWEDEGQRAA